MPDAGKKAFDAASLKREFPLFRHFIERVRGPTGSVYGRRLYEVMRYWDEDRPEWERGETRLRGGVAEPTEVGRVALIEVSRS